MPLYQYRCAEGHVTELMRPVEDASRDAHCSECGQPARRLYKLRGIGFEGPGFHCNDYPRHGTVAAED